MARYKVCEKCKGVMNLDRPRNMHSWCYQCNSWVCEQCILEYSKDFDRCPICNWQGTLEDQS